MGKLKKILPFLLIVLLSYWVIKPLLHSGFFTIHDAAQTARIYQMKKAIVDGQIPPRWAVDLGYGYGYPQFNFYSPLPYYVGVLFTFVGFDYLLATKLLFAMAIILSGFFMYILAKEFWGRIGGLVAAVFYMYCPYFALDLYVRGALAEVWALMFIPLAVHGFIWLAVTGKRKFFYIAALGFSGLILSHNITVMIFSMILLALLLLFIVYLSATKKSIEPVISIIVAVIASVGVTCFFWVPAILESGFTHVKTMIEGPGDYHLHFIAFRQIWDSPWDFGGSAGIYSGLSYMIGKLQIIIAFLGFFVGLYLWKIRRDLAILVLSAFFLFLAMIFMTNYRSVFIWDALSNLAFVQFPWRFLAFAMFFASFLAGAIFFVLKEKKVFRLIKYFLALLLVVLVIFWNKDYFQPKKYLDVDQNYYITGENLYTWASSMSEEYLPIWREKKIFPRPEEKVEILKGDGVLKINEQKSNLYNFEVEMQSKGVVGLNVNYFPGWEMFIDGESAEIIYKDDGLIKTEISRGKHNVRVEFSDSGVRLLVNIISLIFIGFLFKPSFVLKFTHE